MGACCGKPKREENTWSAAQEDPNALWYDQQGTEYQAAAEEEPKEEPKPLTPREFFDQMGRDVVVNNSWASVQAKEEKAAAKGKGGW